MTLAWVTPVDPPGETICIKVYCPSGVEYEACLRGAILSLTEVSNWEKVDGQDTDVVAQAFFDAYQKTLEWRRCVAIGTVLWGGWVSMPDGILPCDGASYAASEYPDLFNAIGYQFGGSGSSFNVPNLHRKFPIGIGGSINPGDTGGSETITLSISQIPSHNHETIPATIGVFQSGAGLAWMPSGLPTGYTGSAGGGQSHGNMPPYLGLVPGIVAR